MWDNPDALNGLSRLILAATLLFALWMTGRQVAETWLPIREVEVTGALHPETRQAIRPVLAGLSGGLFSIDLDKARQGLETLPWVRSASVRRVWPNGLAVTLEEHVPSASWNDTAVLDVHGEAFPVTPWKDLPRLFAPEGMEKEVAQRYGEFTAALAPAGWHIGQIRVDARHTWQLTLADGMTIELGRERLDERLKRFVTFYPLAAERMAGIRRVDMRYPNGFAAQAGASNSAAPEKKRT
ncbi:MAG: cell division protein FtsQ/DivIB [Parasulfuritortus sp.]|nr:cell division protein FtsQ/DivIB [Parasulfuritortus sp.]